MSTENTLTEQSPAAVPAAEPQTGLPPAPISTGTLPQSPPGPAPDTIPVSAPAPGGATPKYRHRRTGFVAKLDKAVRDKINEMLLDGFTFKEILQALGDQVAHIKENSIGTWHDGGYKDWLREQERKEDLRLTRDNTLDILTEKAGEPLQEASRTLAVAQLYELLRSFQPAAFAAAVADDPSLYLRLVNTLSRLSEAEAACVHERSTQALVASKLTTAAPGTTAGPAGKPILTPEAFQAVNQQIKLI